MADEREEPTLGYGGPAAEPSRAHPSTAWATALVAFALVWGTAFAAQQPPPSGPRPQNAEPSRELKPQRPDSRGPTTIARCELEGTVDAGSAAYLIDCVARAEEAGHHALLVRVDTPGGALEATRDIARAFLGAKVPVLVWVGPSGARAGSAGVFITLASHLAAMAPGTNIGAAHPVVGLTGADPEQAGGEHMGRKVENDAVAFAEALARQRGRNVNWAARAVRESASVDAQEAVELEVVELLATSERSFLESADGLSIPLEGGARVLRTAEAAFIPLTPSLRQRLVHWLANPSLAYILFMIGSLGLAIELSNPGMIAPGLIGAVCLVLALIAFSALPIQAGAIVLLVMGLGLIAAELVVASGLLGAAGAVLMALGGLLMVDRVDTDWFVEPSFALPLRLVLPTALFVGGLGTYIAVRASQTRREPQHGGDLGLVGERGRTLEPTSASSGQVFVHGETWIARSSLPIPEGVDVVVTRVDGLTLHVEEVKP